MSSGGALPKINAENIEFVKGWFDDTIPPFMQEYDDNVVFIHIDCDTYQSTKTVLTQFSERMKP